MISLAHYSRRFFINVGDALPNDFLSLLFNRARGDHQDDCNVRFCIWVAGVERSEPPVFRHILGAANTPTPSTY
jgi:hypothetical protein